MINCEPQLITILKRCISLFLICLLGCSDKKETEVQRSFYYWKSVYDPSANELALLSSLSVHKLYLKFFDVSWDKTSGRPLPVAQVRFPSNNPPALLFIPVVFLTNETLQETGYEKIDSLAQKLVNLMEEIAGANKLNLAPEVQVDCDWNQTTRKKYFRLLSTVRVHPFLQNKQLSATIRLHQVKFINESGIPPVDKGLLMCYNMGNLYRPEVKNSILDIHELEKYIGYLSDYPLQLDLALPLFDWYVWFRNNRFKGLIHTPDISLEVKGRKLFLKDTLVNGFSFEKGDWLRYEGSEIEEVKKAALLIRKKIKQEKITVVLYHLDEYNLKKYSPNEMESVFDSFN